MNEARGSTWVVYALISHSDATTLNRNHSKCLLQGSVIGREEKVRLRIRYKLMDSFGSVHIIGGEHTVHDATSVIFG